MFEEIYYFLFTSIKAVKSVNAAANFVNVILTRSEKLMIGKRVAIAFLLRKGAKYDDVCQLLRVSRGTVARVSDRLEVSPGFQKIIDRIIRKEEIELGLVKLFEQVSKFSAYERANPASGFWRYMEKIARDHLNKSLINAV